ncbi:hypothetical protein ACNPPY_08045 [Achromobacter sp. AGC78]|jgi:hypothetical protein
MTIFLITRRTRVAADVRNAATPASECAEAWPAIARPQGSIADLLAMPEAGDIDFKIPIRQRLPRVADFS